MKSDLNQNYETLDDSNSSTSSLNQNGNSINQEMDKFNSNIVNQQKLPEKEKKGILGIKSFKDLKDKVTTTVNKNFNKETIMTGINEGLHPDGENNLSGDNTIKDEVAGFEDKKKVESLKKGLFGKFGKKNRQTITTTNNNLSVNTNIKNEVSSKQVSNSESQVNSTVEQLDESDITLNNNSNNNNNKLSSFNATQSTSTGTMSKVDSLVPNTNVEPVVNSVIPVENNKEVKVIKGRSIFPEDDENDKNNGIIRTSHDLGEGLDLRDDIDPRSVLTQEEVLDESFDIGTSDGSSGGHDLNSLSSLNNAGYQRVVNNQGTNGNLQNKTMNSQNNKIVEQKVDMSIQKNGGLPSNDGRQGSYVVSNQEALQVNQVNNQMNNGANGQLKQPVEELQETEVQNKQVAQTAANQNVPKTSRFFNSNLDNDGGNLQQPVKKKKGFWGNSKREKQTNNKSNVDAQNYVPSFAGSQPLSMQQIGNPMVEQSNNVEVEQNNRFISTYDNDAVSDNRINIPQKQKKVEVDHHRDGILVRAYLGKNYESFTMSPFSLGGLIGGGFYLVFRKVYFIGIISILLQFGILGFIPKKYVLIAYGIYALVSALTTNVFIYMTARMKASMIRKANPKLVEAQWELKAKKMGGTNFFLAFVLLIGVLLGSFYLYAYCGSTYLFKSTLGKGYDVVHNLLGGESDEFFFTKSYNVSKALDFKVPDAFSKNGNLYIYQENIGKTYASCDLLMRSIYFKENSEKFMEIYSEYRGNQVVGTEDVNDLTWSQFYLDNGNYKIYYRAADYDGDIYLIRYKIGKDASQDTCEEYYKTIISSIELTKDW